MADPAAARICAIALRSGGSAGVILGAMNASYLSPDNAIYLEDWAARAGAGDVAAALDGAGTAAAADAPARKREAVQALVASYRSRGHLIASLDPLGLTPKPAVAELELGDLAGDLETVFPSGLTAGKRMKLADILRILRGAYSGPVGVEYFHLTEMDEVHWLRERLETDPVRPPLADGERRHILQRITAAEGLERYLHSKYTGQKRFSLEGGECLIPMLSDLVQRCGAAGAKEVVLGMAHRGRLNVLVNILGKAPGELFEEFEGRHGEGGGGDFSTGDVKYHQGFSSDIMTPGGPVHLALSFNPSHLEIINPVVQGSVRARQHRRGDRRHETVIPLLIHGDAAFAGQGVVMETLNMSAARGFANGGTVHIIVNNQIGFTTSNPLDARSTLYCTEVAKLVQAPIFHVNGDDADAAIFATRLALDYRMEFNKDVVIDLVCYRRHGHNEADEPAVTQPVMYQTIKKHPPPRQVYAARLIAEKALGKKEARAMVDNYRASLEQGKVVAGQMIDIGKVALMVDWKPYLNTEWDMPAATAVAPERIADLHARMRKLPAGFRLHPRIEKIMAERDRMAAGEAPLDWGFAENMAYASLVDEGHQVRLSGQDSGRGTFFHRHAILHNQNNREVHIPLQHIADARQVTVINSLLSEEAVLGFEYGYSTTEPRCLVIWEAQFGDFANGAQVVIDQFISSGEAKWGRLSGLCMLLPHGYEGQGPEHSSARLERYLQLCARHNMQVCVPSTPAQMFHMLRRQAVRPYRRPLVVLTPKSLLRHKLSVSTVDDLAGGGFHTVLDDQLAHDPKHISRVVLCTGKVYFDLVRRRDERCLLDVAIVRVEQLYPFPVKELTRAIMRYPNAGEIIWCQEEPQNQGAWYQTRHHLRNCMVSHQTLGYAGRDGLPSPAVGFYALHLEQQDKLVDDALATEPEMLAVNA